MSNPQLIAAQKKFIERICSTKPFGIATDRIPGTESYDFNGHSQWTFSKEDLNNFFLKEGYILTRNFDTTDTTTCKSKNGCTSLVTEEQLLYENMNGELI